MNLFRFAIAAMAAFSFSAFANQVEPIMGYSVDYEGITYQVSSGGCTKKEDFTVAQLESFPVQLQLVRHKMDFCEAFLPYGTTIKFTWAELGLGAGSQATIANPSAVIYVHQ